MKTLNAIIIDDEKHARDGLAKLLELYCPEVQLLAAGDQITSGIYLIRKHQPDVVFLDIEIGEENGFELLDQLPGLPFQLIFTTAHSEFAAKAFRYESLDYLLKPIQPQQLMEAVDRAKNRLKDNSHEVFAQETQSTSLENSLNLLVPTLQGLNVIQVDNIIHIVGSANYSTFHLESGEKIMASKNLKHFEELLPPSLFFRTHQSHLINLRFLKKICSQEGLMIELEDGFRGPLARRRKEDLIARLQGNSI